MSPPSSPWPLKNPLSLLPSRALQRLFPTHGGFKATTSERNIIFAQVVLNDVIDVLNAAETLRASKTDLINLANTFVPGMVARGGGVVNMTVRTPKRNLTNTASKGMTAWGARKDMNAVSALGAGAIDSEAAGKVVVPLDELLPPPTGTDTSRWLVVHFHLDVCDAMGANAASTVAEGVATTLASMVRGTGPNGHARLGLRIVSNLCVERLARATFRIPVPALGYKSIPGKTVAGRIIEATQWASDDPFRAATHNKGIMNGIDAVAVATGQDWRAIEASAHAWASVSAYTCVGDDENPTGFFREGEFDGESTLPSQFGYRPLTRYWVDRDVGTLYDPTDASGKGLYFCGELELPISVGTRELGWMVAVGLARNFAALWALSTEGIQRGHMSLHARKIAIAAGAPPHAINECVSCMVESQRSNVGVAREYLQAHELHSELTGLGGILMMSISRR
ncbi:hydroxymethylglutaryl-coenzyme A reductase-domain-containing protein [Chytridium lagenaria]|nr:hydroxymethylglutaryl-coenzyme A reductase-domain-containing protein [Chytridium lagenaria]